MSDLDKYKDLINHQSGDQDDEVANFLKRSADAKIPSGKNKEAIWDKISQSIDDDKKENPEAQLGIWRYVGIAASIALIVSFSILYFNQPPGTNSGSNGTL